jgi:peptide/nickel transport system ATP-binding protein
MRLVPDPPGKIVSGEINFSGEDLVKKNEAAMRTVRGKKISMIFQDPMTSLNPVFRIGMQINEVNELHNTSLSKEEVHSRTIEMLKLVGIADPEAIARCYPHELSGGMRQRVMIAMALACSPKLIIADEPTTALDVTIQAQILELLRNLKEKINSSIMLITHDLGVIAEVADFVVVMYAGRIIERGTAEEVFLRPCHPYTIGLQDSKPAVNKRVERLYSIPGNVPNPIDLPDYCYFKDRCEKCVEACSGNYPPEYKLTETHSVSCYRCKDGANG